MTIKLKRAYEAPESGEETKGAGVELFLRKDRINEKGIDSVPFNVWR